MRKENKSLKLRSLPFDITCHPSNDLTAVCNIEGEILLLKANDDDIKVVDTLKHHSDSCRRAIFSDDKMLSISSDGAMLVWDTLSCKVISKHEHDNALYSICEVRDNQVFATGDDEGVIKMWDLRKQAAPLVMAQPEHDNFISSLAVDESGSTLLAASGDGRVSVWNSRQRKLIARSDECDSALLTCSIVRSGTKAVCSDTEGVLNVYSWGDWGDISDRIPVQEGVSIDSVLKYSDEVVLLGCEDGVIRATTLFPHVPLTHLGDHAGNGIEGLAMSGSEVLSIGHDCVVRVWGVEKLELNISKVVKSNVDSDTEDSEESEDEKPKKKKKKLKHASSKDVKTEATADFFSELA